MLMSSSLSSGINNVRKPAHAEEIEHGQSIHSNVLCHCLKIT